MCIKRYVSARGIALPALSPCRESRSGALQRLTDAMLAAAVGLARGFAR